jgi:diphosphomevalonate decarboxylase
LTTPELRTATAVACANIALIKYWGKAPHGENLPAVPSLSLTLDGLETTTHVSFDASLETDEFVLDGRAAAGRPLERVVALLDRVRALSGVAQRARVESVNAFVTASGLASSASGFAALSLAATRAAGLSLSAAELSALARRSSASAARSVFGGYVALGAEREAAEPVLKGAEFPLRMLVVVTTRAPKPVSSTDAMRLTAETSPFYPPWVAHAPDLFERARRALETRDFDALGVAMEQSTWMMHASMLAARPSLRYFTDTTLRVLDRLHELRARAPAYFTMDAGPHVKVLTLPEHAEALAEELGAVPGVANVSVCAPGPGVALAEPARRTAGAAAKDG